MLLCMFVQAHSKPQHPHPYKLSTATRIEYVDKAQQPLVGIIMCYGGAVCNQYYAHDITATFSNCANYFNAVAQQYRRHFAFLNNQPSSLLNNDNVYCLLWRYLWSVGGASISGREVQINAQTRTKSFAVCARARHIIVCLCLACRIHDATTTMTHNTVEEKERRDGMACCCVRWGYGTPCGYLRLY